MTYVPAIQARLTQLEETISRLQALNADHENRIQAGENEVASLRTELNALKVSWIKLAKRSISQTDNIGLLMDGIAAMSDDLVNRTQAGATEAATLRAELNALKARVEAETSQPPGFNVEQKICRSSDKDTAQEDREAQKAEQADYKCTRCDRSMFTKERYMAHIWAKPRCRDTAPAWLRQEMEAENWDTAGGPRPDVDKDVPTHYIHCPVCQKRNWLPTQKFCGLSLNKCPVCKQMDIKDVVPLAKCGHCLCQNCLNRQEAKLPTNEYGLSQADWRDVYDEYSDEGRVCLAFEWWRYEDEMPTLVPSQIVDILHMHAHKGPFSCWWLGRKRTLHWSKTETKNTADRLDNILKELVEDGIIRKLPPTYDVDEGDDVKDREHYKWSLSSEEGSEEEGSEKEGSE